MKKLLIIAALIAALILPAIGFGAAPNYCTQAFSEVYGYQGNTPISTLTFTCTGSAVDGSITNTPTSATITDQISGRYLYTVEVYPTSGGTAPDAADVFILDAAGEDLLGSTDGGTTANKGANLIHATLKKTTMPYSHYLSMFYFPAVTGTLTLKVANQATVSANYTIVLKFSR